MAALMLLAAAGGIAAAQPARWHGTWSATDGRTTLRGTWSANAGDNPDIGLGQWTMLDASGRVIAGGTWSARKAEQRWEGSWRARDPSGHTYSGSWTAQLPLQPPAHFSDMLELSLSKVVSGGWRTARGRAGAWSIRAYTE